MEYGLMAIAVTLAALGWYIAHRLYHQKPGSANALAEAMPTTYKILLRKYYVDEIYAVLIVKPLLLLSRFVLQWVVDYAILGGLAWLLGGTATLGGAILQRWQSGNLRSYAAWLALGAAALLLFLIFGHAMGQNFALAVRY